MQSSYSPLFPFNPSLSEELGRLFAKPPDTSSAEAYDTVMAEFRRNGRDTEYCPELESPEHAAPKSAQVRRAKKAPPRECVFCKNNGEQAAYYRQHALKDADGRVSCPILRAYTCTICGSTGDSAHTLKYCPRNKNPEVVATMNILKSFRNAAGKQSNSAWKYRQKRQ